MSFRLNAIIMCFAVLGCVPHAWADCDPLDFVVKDFTSTVVDDRVAIAFLKTASKEQYEAATKNIGGSGSYGLISGSGHFDQSRQSANKESNLTRFDYSRDYYLNFISQQLSPTASSMYSSCLEADKQTPGFKIWLKKRQGDYYTLNAFWVGGDNDGVGKYDGEAILDNVTIIQKPENWPRAKTQEIVIKKATNVDGFIGVSVSGQTGSFVTLKDPVTIPILSKIVVSSKLMQAHTTRVSGTVCPGGNDSDCIGPSKPGGYLVVGSAAVTEHTSGQVNRSPVTVTKDTPEQICMSMEVSTGACEAGNAGTARLTAVERYPATIEGPNNTGSDTK